MTVSVKVEKELLVGNLGNICVQIYDKRVAKIGGGKNLRLAVAVFGKGTAHAGLHLKGQLPAVSSDNGSGGGKGGMLLFVITGDGFHSGSSQTKG